MKEYVINIVKGTFGDDLERATSAFKNYTKEQLDEKYGFSDSTCQEILDAYKLDRENRIKAVRWLEKIEL